MVEYSLNELREISELVKRKAEKRRSYLIKEEYDSENPSNQLEGLCYVVSETMYHLTGGKKTWRPEQMEHEGVSHWFLVHKETETIFDLTESQFDTSVPHNEARGRGFCTGEPSEKASSLIRDIEPHIRTHQI